MSKESFLKQHINSIVHSDNIEFMKQLPDGCIDIIFADPPYNMSTRASTPDFRKPNKVYVGVIEQWDKLGGYYDYKVFCKKWLTEFKRILHPNGSAWVMGTQHGIFTIGCLIQELGFKIINDVQWNKTDGIPSLYPYKLNPRHETLIWFTHDDNKRYTFNYHTLKKLGLDEVRSYRGGAEKQLGTVWTLGICKGYERMRLNTNERLHPTQKPEALMRLVLTVCSREHDLVLDPFSGTGTTAAVAKEMGRRYIGVEKEAKYIDASRARLRAIQPNLTSIEKCVYDTDSRYRQKKTRSLINQ